MLKHIAPPAVVSTEPPPYPHAEKLVEQGLSLFFTLFLIALIILALMLVVCILFEHAERRIRER
jgi:heme/copper-type cytochrome/quinol oxidase subunit 2